MRFNTRNRERVLIYVVFVLFLTLWHIPMEYYGDDVVVSALIGERTIWEHTIIRFNSNGRVFCDVLAYAFYFVPMAVWKTTNIGVFVLIAALMTYLFTDNSNENLLATCALILLFPLDYLVTAGWIATCANYLYTFLALLIVAYILKSIMDQKRVPKYWQMIGLLATLYGTNQDQSAMILIGGTLLLWIYAKVSNSYHKKATSWILVYFVGALICYLAVFFTPGHLSRMAQANVDMEPYFPEYISWGVLEKIYHGYSATMALVLFERNRVFGLFGFLLMLLSLRNKKWISKIVGMIPAGTYFLLTFVNPKRFIHYSYILPDLRPLTTLGGKLALLISVVVLLSCVYAIWNNISRERAYAILWLMVLGGGSRLMMGFTITLFYSATRTFTFLVFALIACCLVLLDEFRKTEDSRMFPVGLACVIVICCMQ